MTLCTQCRLRTWYQQGQQKKKQKVKGCKRHTKYTNTNVWQSNTSCFSWLHWLHGFLFWALPENVTKRCVVQGCEGIKTWVADMAPSWQTWVPPSDHRTSTKWHEIGDWGDQVLLSSRCRRWWPPWPERFLKNHSGAIRHQNHHIPALLGVKMQPLSSIIEVAPWWFGMFCLWWFVVFTSFVA